MTVTLSPSLAAATFEALDYLTSYPYGCAEQTISNMLPWIVAPQLRAAVPEQPRALLELVTTLRARYGAGFAEAPDAVDTDSDFAAASGPKVPAA